MPVPRNVLSLLLMVVAVCGQVCASNADSPELVRNGSMELADGSAPKDWTPERWGDDVSLRYVDAGRGGGKCLMIETGATARDSQWMQNIRPLKPYSQYRFRGWIKTENAQAADGGGVGFVLHGAQYDPPKPLTGTHDWTLVDITFQTGRDDGVRIGCFLGVNRPATGKVWFDDLSLQWISSEELHPAAVIDATHAGAPISKYIYGQFIEHLGRCVNGQGIWAEMIEDRKFYHPIGKQKFEKDLKGVAFRQPTPWQIVGTEQAVTMNTASAYVGQFAPEIVLPGDGAPAGLSQGGLGLIARKEYTGRIILAGDRSAAPVQVSLIWGTKPEERQTVTIDALSTDYAVHPLRFAAGASTDNARIEIVGRGKGTFRIGTLSLMPADNVQGMRRDTLDLMKQLNAPVYRWPGGCFVGGYDWRDGVGVDRDKRPPRGNTFWRGIEPNDFGLDEFMALCRELQTEPYICVDTGPGTAELAVQEVQYVNGPADSPMGALRARNGHAGPYGCHFWAVGNEMFGTWEPGHMPLEQYVHKHNAVAQAMRKVDPSILLMGVGEVGPWSEGMLRECSANMDHMSEHFYKQDWHPGGFKTHVQQIPDEIRRRVEAHRAYRKTIPALAGKDIRIVMDEWNYWYGPHIYGELGTRYFLKDTLGIAAGLHEFYRNSDLIFMANYAQTVNVIGAIKTTKTAAAMEGTGLVLSMYRQHYGELPVQVGGDYRPLDIAAAWSSDHQTLTIGIVNPTMSAWTLPLQFVGATPAEKGTIYWITGADPEVYNTPGKPPRITQQSREVVFRAGSLEVPAASACILSIPAAAAK